MNLANVKHTISGIKNPKPFMYTNKKKETGEVKRPLEHHVASFACTVTKHVFSNDDWIITPEKADKSSNRKPDLTIERLTENALEIHLYYELKKDKGDRMEDALHQTIVSIIETLDLQGSNKSQEFDVYVVIQRGMEIAFFEYHNYASLLDDEDVENIKGAVSLTQPFRVNGVLTEIIPIPHGAGLLFREASGLDMEKDGRKEASRYKIPCVLRLDVHEREIDFLFHHMATNKPRSLDNE